MYGLWLLLLHRICTRRNHTLRTGMKEGLGRRLAAETAMMGRTRSIQLGRCQMYSLYSNKKYLRLHSMYGLRLLLFHRISICTRRNHTLRTGTKEELGRRLAAETAMIIVWRGGEKGTTRRGVYRVLGGAVVQLFIHVLA